MALLLLLWKMGCCEHLRIRRAKRLPKLDPHSVLSHTLFVEFPFLYRCAFESGVVRVAGIPRIIAKFGLHNVAKQYDDMDILLREMLMHHADSPRGSLAIRRLNFIHSFYAIANEDYLYVLAVYVVNFVEWTDKYGYRKLTEMEKGCHYRVWHDIAKRMGIHNIPPSVEELARYRDEYEAKHMRYSDCNREFAEAGMKLMLGEMPWLCRRPLRKLLLSVLDERLLAALGFPKQPAWLGFMARSLLNLHKLTVRWMPPRPLSCARTRISLMTGCPLLFNLSSSPLELQTLPLSFHRFRPRVYENGYKIAHLGGMKPGRVGSVCSIDAQGGLLCPPLTLAPFTS
ncbi:hypothetical protein GOP47_0025967 [Adiantum capillus-veneris]|uniref:ER-bound oxygenase mpaB/mpaB'/Rubber oxygenase catalytic domain-containing protein n=1 Tax=Adiantum capillus-veneris TaxID=13818 RepID=A0A9D4Z2K2_ADICA|nr:hypothetical protein GOP47_0025967 [Adiantum capillus-veneris]